MLPIISQARFVTTTRSHHVVIPGPAFSLVLLHSRFHNVMVTWREGRHFHPIGDALLLLTDKSVGVGRSLVSGGSPLGSD